MHTVNKSTWLNITPSPKVKSSCNGLGNPLINISAMLLRVCT
jgi:hypothetical protein